MLVRTCRLLATLIVIQSTTLALAGEPTAPTPLEPELKSRCLEILRAGLVSDEFWPAMHAAEALTLAGESDAVLTHLATRKETDDQKRCGLAREAVRAGDRSQLPILLEILEKEGSNGHVHAAESLFKVAEVGDGAALRAALNQTDDPRLQIMAATALSRCGHPTAIDAIRDHISHDDLAIRKLAFWAIGQVGEAADRQRLLDRPGQDAEDDLARAYVAQSLALLGDADAVKTLGANLNSPDVSVRTYAAEFIGHARAAAFRDELEKLLDDETLDVRVRAAQSLFALAAPPVDHTEIIVQDVFPASAENPRYSEGSIINLADGRLLYATTEFIGGAADAAKAHVIARESADGGRSWGEKYVLQENTGQQNVMSITLRRLEPGAVAGPLGLFYLVKNGPDDLHVFLRVSNDEAKTFSEPIQVTQGPGYHIMNNDRVTVLASGRIICPLSWAAHISDPQRSHLVCFCFYSDDQGRSWKKSTDQVDAPRRGAMEPEVIELADGRLMMIIRTQMGYIATSYSEDGGDHWSEIGQLSVAAPESPATIRRIPATGDLLLVWNNNYEPGAGHSGARNPLTLAISRDEGQTWEHIKDLETTPGESYAYTSILFVNNRALLSYYVAEPRHARISSRFRSIPLQWVYQ